MLRRLLPCLIIAASLAGGGANAAELRVLTTGAFKQVLVAALAGFQQRTGHTVSLDNDTAGALVRRIRGGEAFDLVVLTPAAVADFVREGRIVAGSGTDLARVGIGVAVRQGAPLPDIQTTDDFTQAVLRARAVAYIDPASGGSSGVYLAGLFARLGIADRVAPKAVLVPGGLVADRVASGEADLAIHQISEIVPVQGVVLVGPLPAEIQNYTTYAAGIGSQAAQPDAARDLLAYLATPATAGLLAQRGMEPAQR